VRKREYQFGQAGGEVSDLFQSQNWRSVLLFGLEPVPDVTSSQRQVLLPRFRCPLGPVSGLPLFKLFPKGNTHHVAALSAEQGRSHDKYIADGYTVARKVRVLVKFEF